MWTLHPTHCALRPVEFQTENKCDIIGLNDRGPLWYYSGSTASPCYLLFISFASSVHVSVLFVCESLSPLPKTCLLFLAVIRFASLVCKNHQPQKPWQLTKQVRLCRLDMLLSEINTYSLWLTSLRALGDKWPHWKSRWADRKQENLLLPLIMEFDNVWPC